MNVKERLEGILSAPISKPEDADRVREAADLLASYLRLEQRVAGLVEGELEHRPGSSLAGVSLHEAAERILEDAGTPLHAKELGALMKARGWRHPRSKVARPEQIVHQLAARLPRYPDRFRKVAPQTFALKKWGDDYPGKRVKPRMPLFKGPGGDIARQIGEHPEAPFEDEGASWRSS